MTALLLTTLIGAGIVIVRLWSEVGPLRTEVRQLRDDVGALSIDDSSKIHAIQVRTYNELAWKWRVWIPNGENVEVKYLWGAVPRTGYPQTSDGIKLEPGENWITLHADRDGLDGCWNAKLLTEKQAAGIVTHGGRGTGIPDEAVWFAREGAKSTYFFGEEIGISTVAEVRRDKEFLLMRKRVVQSDNVQGVSDSDQPLPGIIIWLERP